MINGSEEPTRDELLELAMLEAMGQLDEVEEARLDRAFRAASPSLQDEIRALQLRIASDPALRSAEQPPASLRLRTLARVAHAIEEDAAAAAPIAMIGQGSRERGADSNSGSVERLNEDMRRRAPVANGGVSAVWRVAALLAFAALAVTLYFNAQTAAISRSLVFALQNQSVEEQLTDVARRLAGLDLRDEDRVALKSRGGAPGDAWSYVDRTNQRLVVVGMGLATDLGVLTVRIVDDAGNARVLERVACNGSFARVYALPAEFAAAGARIELVDGDGAVLYASA